MGMPSLAEVRKGGGRYPTATGLAHQLKRDELSLVSNGKTLTPDRRLADWLDCQCVLVAASTPPDGLSSFLLCAPSPPQPTFHTSFWHREGFKKNFLNTFTDSMIFMGIQRGGV